MTTSAANNSAQDFILLMDLDLQMTCLLSPPLFASRKNKSNSVLSDDSTKFTVRSYIGPGPGSVSADVLSLLAGASFPGIGPARHIKLRQKFGKSRDVDTCTDVPV